MAAIPNVIIFGEVGVGKSSLVNLIADKYVAEVSSRLKGCTFQSKCHTVDIGEMRVNLYDTAGLEEGNKGTVAKHDAIVQLYTLLRELETGVGLLILCIRGNLRMRESYVKNWRLFWEIICQSRVPIVLAVTGLEDEEQGMDSWWTQNEEGFTEYGMYPNGVACITATRGRRGPDGSYRFGEEYAESQVKIRKAIRRLYLRSPWRVPTAEWFKTIIETTYKERRFKSPEEIQNSRRILGSATRELVARCEMTENEATTLAEKLNGMT